MKTYRARARRSGDWWAIDVTDLPGAFTQAKRVAQVEPRVREVIALLLDVPESGFEVDVDYQLPKGIVEALASLAKARRAAEETERALSDTLRSTAVALTRAGLSYRDAGTLAGVSHQRVGQLLGAAGHAKHRPRNELHHIAAATTKRRRATAR